ncbi:LMBR1-like protein lilipod isoform X2 [Amblyomma americanum]
MEDEADARERLFHNAVREILIHFLFFVVLYVFAYVLISKFKKKKDDYFADDDEDAVVYRISLWMCCFSLAVSLGAALLLPVSIISNEVLLLYPSSFYMQWLNSSLIHGLWNEIFLFSNVSIFILLPFAYLFTESEGLPGSRRGLISRLYETFLVLMLVAALLFGMTFLLSAILDYGRASIHSLFALWRGYLPFLYSCLSCFGVMLLLMCTPVGFARLFTVLGELVMKPKFLRDIQEEYQCTLMEEENLGRRTRVSSHELEIRDAAYSNGTNGCVDCAVQRRLAQLERRRKELALQQLASPWRRNLGYPIAMLALLSLTVISLLMVIHNTLQLLIGIKALPVSSQVELPLACIRGGLLLTAHLLSTASQASVSHTHPGHWELCRLAAAELGFACFGQDTGHHQLRPPGGLWPHRVAGQLSAGAHLQPGVCGCGCRQPGDQGDSRHAHRAARTPGSVEAALTEGQGRLTAVKCGPSEWLYIQSFFLQ